jgi:hypothetical protein
MNATMLTDWQRSEDGKTWEHVSGEVVEAQLLDCYRNANAIMVDMINHPGQVVRTRAAVYRYQPQS